MNYGNYPNKDIKRILIINLRHLGDLLLTTPMYRCIKRAWPHVEIDGFIYKNCFDILDKNPYVSEILTYDENIKKMGFAKRIFEEWKILKRIRDRKYDLIINSTEGDRGALIAKFSKAKYKIGPDEGSNRKKNIYTHLVKNCGSKHRVEKNLDFVRRLGISPLEEDKDLFFYIPEETRVKIRALLRERKVEDFILIHPISRWRFKSWPIFKWRNLLKMLDGKIVLSGSIDEKEILDQIGEGFDILNLAGKLSLKELGALIEMSRMLVCVDSVPLHIASALKSKCVVLFGPTQDKVWGPWKNEHAKILSENFSCRPCCLDGCGGSKISECLNAIDEKRVLDLIT